MKIIKDDTTYIQIKDLKRLRDSKLLTNSLLFILHILSSDRLDYKDDEFIKLEDQSISFENEDWIINFDDIKDLSEKELIDICNDLIYERNQIANKYNSCSMRDRLKNLKLLIKSRDLKYQIDCYKELLDVMNGNKELDLPKGVEFPDGFIKESKVKKLINKLKK